MQTRQKILETAADLFYQQGYNSTGINQIISESQVAKASFYAHFSSKEDLCVATLDWRHEHWFAELKRFTLGKRTVKTQIAACFQFITYMNAKENFRGCNFLNILSEISSNNKKILSVIQNHKNDLRHYFKSI